MIEEEERKGKNLVLSSKVSNLTFTQITFACIWSDVIMAVTRRDGTIPALTRDFSLPSLYARLQNIEAHPRRRFSSLKYNNEEYYIDYSIRRFSSLKYNNEEYHIDYSIRRFTSLKYNNEEYYVDNSIHKESTMMKNL